MERAVMARNNRKKGDLEMMRESWARFVEESIAMNLTLAKMKLTIDNHYTELSRSTSRLWKLFFIIFALMAAILREVI